MFNSSMFLRLLVGSGDLIPVIGFFCQRCEEFFGDLKIAEKHAAGHNRNEKKQVKLLGQQYTINL